MVETLSQGIMKEDFTMSNYPNTITMGNEVKEVFVRELGGYCKWLVVDDAILVDQNYLGELFSKELCLT